MATSLREPVSAFVALGANLGHPAQAVSKALTDLAQLPHTQVKAVSELYESAPHQADGPMYVNAVAALSTSLNAFELLQALQAMEQQAGRQRSVQNAPRTLDLDLLFFWARTTQQCLPDRATSPLARAGFRVVALARRRT